MTLLKRFTPSVASSSQARGSAMLKKRPRARHALQAVVAFVVLAATVGVPAAVINHPLPPATTFPVEPPMMDTFADRPIHLAPATTQPIAAPATLARARMADREVFAFAPYWNLDTQQIFDLRHVTTLAYFGVDVAKDGSIKRSGNGWVGYQSHDLADLISPAHR